MRSSNYYRYFIITGLLILTLLLSSVASANSQAQTQPTTFTDGYGGNVFTAKDLLMSGGWATRNGGIHPDLQSSPHEPQRVLLEFNLSSIPAGSVLVSATLYLYHSYPSETSLTANASIYSVAYANSTWIEGTKNIAIAGAGEPTWNALAANGSGGVTTAWAGSIGCSTMGIDYEPALMGSFTWSPRNDPIGKEYAIALDLNRVAGWFGASNTNYGIIVNTLGGTGHFGSAEHLTTAYRPKLVVRYTSTASSTPTATSVLPPTSTPLAAPTATPVQPTAAATGVPLYSDNFNDNLLNPAWTVYGGNWSETGQVLRQTSLTTGSPKKVILAGANLGANQTIVAKVRVDSWVEGNTSSRAGVSLFTGTADGQGYNLLFVRDHATVRFLNEAASWGPAYTFNWTTATWYWFKLKMENGVLSGKIWQDGASEPATWQFTWTISGRTGFPGLNGGSNNGSTVSFDDVTVTAP